jgi:hypothetical protein
LGGQVGRNQAREGPGQCRTDRLKVGKKIHIRKAKSNSNLLLINTVTHTVPSADGSRFPWHPLYMHLSQPLGIKPPWQSCVYIDLNNHNSCRLSLSALRLGRFSFSRANCCCSQHSSEDSSCRIPALNPRRESRQWHPGATLHLCKPCLQRSSMQYSRISTALGLTCPFFLHSFARYYNLDRYPPDHEGMKEKFSRPEGVRSWDESGSQAAIIRWLTTAGEGDWR